LGVLVAGFQKRVEYLESLGFDHALFQYFPQDLPRFLREAWIGKMDPKPYQDNLLLYDKTIRAYLDALRFLSADTSAMDGLGLCQEVRRRHLTLQNQKYLKRNVHELLVLASHISVRRCQWGLRWLTGSRRKTVLCFLLHMHLAAIDYIHGKPEANSHIQLAWSHLDQLYWGCSSTRRYQSSFLNQWRQLRIQFADFASEFFRFYLGKGEYFASILEEQPVPSDLHR
jgi:hypothetical protein